jgi:hypothetical protein
MEQPGKTLRRAFSFEVMLALGLAVITVCTISNRFQDPDLWWHLKIGEIVWQTHSVPSTDTLSYTAYGHEWMAHEWLAELSIYTAYHFWGNTGLSLWLAALGSTLFILIYRLCNLAAHDPLLAFMGGVCAWFFASVGLAIRPLLLGHLFLAAELAILEFGTTGNRRRLWLLPPLFAVWVNCHGSYLFGLGVLGVYFASSFMRGKWGPITAEGEDTRGRARLGILLLVCVAATCCNPVGIRLLTYPFNLYFQQTTNLAAVQEWAAPNLREPRAIGLIAVTFAVFLLPFVRRTPIRLRDCVLVLTAFVLASRHLRMLILFGIVAAPVLCRLVPALLPEDRRREHPAANAALMAVFLAVMVWIFPTPAAIQRQIRAANPTGAVDYIRRTGLAGPMLNDYGYGGYLIWALPERKVFIDGRADLFDWTGVFAEYGRWAMLEEDPKLLLDKYHIRFCIFPKNAPLMNALPYLPGWSKVYADNVAVVYAR